MFFRSPEEVELLACCVATYIKIYSAGAPIKKETTNCNRKTNFY